MTLRTVFQPPFSLSMLFFRWVTPILNCSALIQVSEPSPWDESRSPWSMFHSSHVSTNQEPTFIIMIFLRPVFFFFSSKIARIGVCLRSDLLSEQSICTILQVVGLTPTTIPTVFLGLGFQYSLLLGTSVIWHDNNLERMIPPTYKVVRCPYASLISQGSRETHS